jgi:hypothetical protein
MTPTAVEGGHITNLDDSNSVIRRIVEARNAKRDEEEVAQEIQEELKHAGNMERVEPLPGVFDEENPKDTVGTSKIPLHLWPTSATIAGTIAMLNGALKYGRSNWRKTPVKASIYYDALLRHAAAWWEGEDFDEEGVHHLGAALACIAILIDAWVAGRLVDDRQFPGGHKTALDKFTPQVATLRAQHADKRPHHYTIQDR